MSDTSYLSSFWTPNDGQHSRRQPGTPDLADNRSYVIFTICADRLPKIIVPQCDRAYPF
jgi:hypothetical protein